MTDLLNELEYISLEDARDTSSILALVIDDDILTEYITSSQWIIDNYIGFYKTKFDIDQTFLFPTADSDWLEEAIPVDIKLATIQISEYLYTKGTETVSSLEWKDIKSESNQSRSISYSDKKQKYSSLIETIQIPLKTLNILNKYKGIFIWQVI